MRVPCGILMTFKLSQIGPEFDYYSNPLLVTIPLDTSIVFVQLSINTHSLVSSHLQTLREETIQTFVYTILILDCSMKQTLRLLHIAQLPVHRATKRIVQLKMVKTEAIITVIFFLY